MVLFKIKKVVIGDAKNMTGREEFLREKGVEVVVLNDKECIALLDRFAQEKPDVW